MVHENLKKIRSALGLSRQEPAGRLNVNVNTYRGREYNEREIPISILQLLIYSFRININWFLTDEGGIFIQNENFGQKTDDTVKNEDTVLNTEEIKLLKKFIKYCKEAV